MRCISKVPVPYCVVRLFGRQRGRDHRAIHSSTSTRLSFKTDHCVLCIPQCSARCKYKGICERLFLLDEILATGISQSVLARHSGNLTVAYRICIICTGGAAHDIVHPGLKIKVNIQYPCP